MFIPIHFNIHLLIININIYFIHILYLKNISYLISIISYLVILIINLLIIFKLN